MSYCRECGHELHDKFLENEGMIPYCDHCEQFRFPMFNTAISAIVYDPSGEHIILIQQYGKKRNILVAGYVTKGEGVEQTLVREIKEELGLNVVEYTFNASEYFAPSNTLMVNFACRVDSDKLDGINEEIDYVQWYTPEEAKENILHDSLAERFLLKWLGKQETYRPKRQVLCFGDSNTFGHNPVDMTRLPRQQRWPGILAELIGKEYHIIEEGCNGRTTIFEDPAEPWKCGKSYLKACLNTHKPLDMIIMMLGTNDIKGYFHATADDITAGAAELIDMMQSFTMEKQGFVPKILLMAPPKIGEHISEGFFGNSFGPESTAVSLELAEKYEKLAQEKGCYYLNAASVADVSEEDQLHLMPAEHEKLAQAVKDMILDIKI